jgi:hypothetical protein
MRQGFGVPTASLRRSEATRAAAICQQLIECVEGALLGRTSCTVFIEDSQHVADELTQLLSQAGCGLDDRLEWFRDCLLPSGDYEAQWSGERLLYGLGVGVPVFATEDGDLHLHYSLTLQWLELMRGFSLTLRAAAVVSKRRRNAHGKGGRPKSKDVRRLEVDVQRLYENEAQRLRKEGMGAEAVERRLKGLTRSNLLRQLQESPSWAAKGVRDQAMLRRIGRTPAWQQLHSPSGMVPMSRLDESSDSEGISSRRDDGWALMNQLNVRQSTRTKLSGLIGP